jgi:EAL domain-containing protein (putative c-di-GMP-specific phosphodiesterase class I)
MESKRLLVIDDNPDLTSLIRQFAGELGCDTRAACGQHEIEPAVQEFKPDAIVLDLMMPDTDGVEVLRYLAERHSDAGIIIISGGEPRIMDVTTRLAQALHLRLVGALAKPIRLFELEHVLRRAFGIRPKISEAELRRALGEGEIAPFFQAKVSVKDPKRIVGAEILARWTHSEYGNLAPQDFIPLAEQTGLITDLTLALMDRALDQARTAALDHALSLNISPRSLDERELPDALEERCRKAGWDPGRVVFEVTEGVAGRDFAEVMAALTRLRLKGFALSMDDYGTGYSSLVHLVRLPFSEVKIDRSFVSEIGSSRDSAIVVRSTVSMAHSMGLTVCAEGVEDAHTAQFLDRSGCDTMQGYLVGKPLPIDQFVAFASALV